MKVRIFNANQDYDIVAKWWTTRGLPAIPSVILNGALGVMVEDRDHDLAVGWAYFDEMNVIGLVDWITTNPAYVFSPTITQAIGHVLAFFEDEANRRGCHNLFTFVEKDTGLQRFLVRKHGWQDPHSAPHVYLFKSF